MLTPQLDIYTHLAPRLASKRVLEVGFGTGGGVLQYAANASVRAIELDEAAVRFAKRAFPVGAEWEHADILSYASHELFDAVVMIEVLEHIHDWYGALAKVAGLLNDGGTFYLSHRNANADLRKNDLHEREWTAQELLWNLSAHFRDVTLYDYSLSAEQEADSRVTPLVAVCNP